MMQTTKRELASVVFAVLVLAGAQTTEAGVIPVPSGLNAGDQYHIVFITTQIRDGTSANISDYNNFVNSVAEDAGIGPVSAGNQWRAIASTPSTDASANISVTAPVYNMNSELVANNAADLWDGTIANTIAYEEDGTYSNSFAWTGTLPTGVGDGDRTLGSSTSSLTVGSSIYANAEWINSVTRSSSFEYPLYAISDTLTVTPEPSPLAMMGIGALGLAGYRWRRRRKAKE